MTCPFAGGAGRSQGPMEELDAPIAPLPWEPTEPGLEEYRAYRMSGSFLSDRGNSPKSR
jgi:hypothetical protein